MNQCRTIFQRCGLIFKEFFMDIFVSFVVLTTLIAYFRLELRNISKELFDWTNLWSASSEIRVLIVSSLVLLAFAIFIVAVFYLNWNFIQSYGEMASLEIKKYYNEMLIEELMIRLNQIDKKRLRYEDIMAIEGVFRDHEHLRKVTKKFCTNRSENVTVDVAENRLEEVTDAITPHVHKHNLNMTKEQHKKVYLDTAKVPKMSDGKAKTKSQPKKERGKHRDKSDLGDNFIAPDGGWAWVVCIAAGLSNLCIFPSLQQFGFIFRGRLKDLGMTSSQITTIINTQPAISACTGLLNGPMFRRFTFRQVAIAGALFNFCGLFLTAFSDTFFSYMITYALLFGFGMGISVSASSLAINTYFKNKRRRAAGFSWTLTGLGPIFLPYAVMYLLSAYGVQGTVIIFASISLHSLVCAMVYQPVRNHVRQTSATQINSDLIPSPDPEYLCKFCEMNRQKNTGIFSSQYLYTDDDNDKPGYEIIDPGTPMLSRANDGWFGSKLSIASTKPQLRFRTVSSCKDIEGGFRLNHVIAEEDEREERFLRPNYFSREREEIKLSASRNNLYIRADSLSVLRCTCAEEKALLELPKGMTTISLAHEKKLEAEPPTPPPSEDSSSVTFLQKIVAFFDLDLLRDFTFVNLVAGLTIINFGELNFSILTPFILTDFGFTNAQISLAMSVLGGMDITVRFLVPFITEKIEWDNRVFLLIGVVGIALGRTVVASSRSYSVILGCFVIIGMFKGLRTIFWPLIIPGYVPLKRLPAASGLQLIISGVFTLACGPVVGLIRDRYNFSVTLHCLNALTFIAAISWSTEALLRYLHRRKKLMACVKT